MSELRHFRYEPETQTIRSIPENYWIATVRDNKLIIFDSWDSAIEGRFNKVLLQLRWRFGLIGNTTNKFINK